MKALGLFLSLTAGIFSAVAMADSGYGRRYATSYVHFDSAIYSHYSYRETSYQACGYNTCLNSFQRTDRVYVEETVFQDRELGQQRVIKIYESERYERTVVTYYVSQTTTRSYITARRYNPEVYYYRSYNPYLMPGTSLTTAIMDRFDAESAAVLVAGGIVFDVGLNMATVCQSKECMEAAGAVALAGLASTSAASLSNAAKEAKRTELELRIRNLEKAAADDVM